VVRRPKRFCTSGRTRSRAFPMSPRPTEARRLDFNIRRRQAEMEHEEQKSTKCTYVFQSARASTSRGRSRGPSSRLNRALRPAVAVGSMRLHMRILIEDAIITVRRPGSVGRAVHNRGLPCPECRRATLFETTIRTRTHFARVHYGGCSIVYCINRIAMSRTTSSFSLCPAPLFHQAHRTLQLLRTAASSTHASVVGG